MHAEQWNLLVFPEEQGKLTRQDVIDFVNINYDNYQIKHPMGLIIWFEDNQWNVKFNRILITE